MRIAGSSSRDDRSFDPEDYFSVPLYDLGADNQAFSGILAPEPERGAEKIGITAQFLENAHEYHARYLNTDHYEKAFAKALVAVGFDAKAGLEVLDIGTGSGVNSVMPCARLFDTPRIVATDLSPQLLKILQLFLADARLPAEVACVCMDSSRDFFQPGCFDIVSGAAILHHLIDPSAALKSAYRALRPGGIAIFFEPFEAGHLIQCMTYRQILRLKDHLGGIGRPAEKVLRDMVLDWSTRAGTDKSAQHFLHMDDKWIFTRSYFRQTAAAIGFEDPIIIPQYDPVEIEGSYAGMTRRIFRLHSGLEPDSLPDWAWEMFDEMDRTLTQEMKDDLLLEGVIVLRKPGSGDQIS